MVANKGLVRLHQSCESSTELITDMANLAKSQDLVDDSFLVAILEREKNYPTGLELPISIAIPHIDTGVKKSFVSVATLHEPVVFYNMDGSGSEVQARIVFVFGITDAKNQLAILKKFAISFAQEEKIKPLLETRNPDVLLEGLNMLLDGMLDINQCEEEVIR